ncbi:amino acid permease [Rhodocytophaga rosea]|uniref:Amino acid permease n=1 Tax=Rhodocytophaga rosea TaxID=2704465 RepID=A0A6C0GTU4_9BACT|nr:amino acid permease [Rhodocytophaga rosea]QHT71598.1 amino acid permease [Rhodocytophaga rosea]
MPTSNAHHKTIGLHTAASIAIANMVGTGVFTSLGYQVVDIQSVFALIMLWIVGGIIALCGALSYGELGTALPRSGGEYHLLTAIYHPAMGFLSGWVSATAGFVAPTAIAAIALGKYTAVVFPSVPVNHLAAVVVIVFAVIHSISIRLGSYFQNFFTLIKIGVMLIFIFFGFTTNTPQSISLLPEFSDWKVLLSPPFAVSLVYVSYAYTGWNASIYVVGELRNPQKNLPKALFLSTLLVLVLYALLNYVFLYTVPMAELAGKVEIGFLAGNKLFGTTAADVLSLLIAALMISTISAMIFVGARITQVMGEDYPALHLLSLRTVRHTPVNAILFQTLITLIFIYTSSFEQVIVYAAFTLMLLTTLTVAGVYVLRWRRPDLPRPYKTWGYPFTPALFLLANTWIMIYVLIERPLESCIGLGIIAAGALIYFINSRMAMKKASE